MSEESSAKVIAELAARDANGRAPDEPLERFGLRIQFPEPFLQKHLEEFQRVNQQLGGESKLLAFVRRAAVQAGIKLGWIQGVSAGDVGELSPGAVRWASLEILDFVRRVQEIPPE